MTDPAGTNDTRLRVLARERSRLAVMLTTIMIVIYFGFIALIGFDKPLLGRRIGSGLSLGIILGALVIVATWVLTWVYVRWMNAHYDTALRAIEGSKEGGRS